MKTTRRGNARRWIPQEGCGLLYYVCLRFLAGGKLVRGRTEGTFVFMKHSRGAQLGAEKG